MDNIKVYMLTGFLGSGKTTALNHLLSCFAHQRNVVIENEFGKISIDSMLVQNNYSNFYELSNGCICCNLDDELYDVLYSIDRLEKRPDNLFIETTGVADAGNVAAIFKRGDVAEAFDLKKIICLIDTENIAELLRDVPETARQIVAANIIAFNKIDHLSFDYINEMIGLIKSINPFAKTITTKMGLVPYQELLEDGRRSLLSFNEDTAPAIKRNGHKIVSVSFSTAYEFDLDTLYHILSFSLSFYYNQLYRIKGIVKTMGNDQKILLQSTGKYLHMEKIGEWKDEPPVSRIVIIGIGLKKDFIERLLRDAFHKAFRSVDVGA